MKKLSIFIPLVCLFLFASCDEIEDRVTGSTDAEVTIEEAEAQNYNLTTPYYGIRVAINQSVSANPGDLLDFIDSKIIDFLNCQFAGGENIGFEDFELSDGTIIPPLNQLRIYIVPKTFECSAVDRDVCSGIYFYDEDIVVIAKNSFGRCEDYALTQHEVAHRYGLRADHSNQRQFSDCSDPRDCDLGDLIREDNLSSDYE